MRLLGELMNVEVFRFAEDFVACLVLSQTAPDIRTKCSADCRVAC